MLLAGFLMPVMLELAQAQVFYDLGRQREEPSEAAGPGSLESNSCSGKCPLPHNSLQQGRVTSETWSSSIPVYQLPELPSACVSATIVSRDPEKRSSEHHGKHICPVAAGQLSAHVLPKPLTFKEWFCLCQRGAM